MQTAKCSNCGRYMGLNILRFYKTYYKEKGITGFKYMCPRCMNTFYNVGVNFKGTQIISMERIK